MSWFSKDDPPPKPLMIPEILVPGDCECTHSRCSHVAGKGECMAAISKDDDAKILPKDQWTGCACQIYIRADDDDDDESNPDTPDDPEVVELEKMAKL